MRSRVVRVLVVGCCLFAVSVGRAGAAPGDVDRTFGQEGGVRIQSERGAYVFPEDMAVGPEGEIYFLRSSFRCSNSPCQSEELVSRYTFGGRLDSSFGVAGERALFRSTAAFRYSGDGSLAVAPDGRIVVGSVEEGKLLLGRLNPDGTPDAGFGYGGEIRADLIVPIDRVRVAVQADGRVVVGAEPVSGYGGNAVLVARYTAQGFPDPSFRSGGQLVTNLGSGLGGLALDEGKTLIAGPRCCRAEGRGVHLARIDERGVFDSDFGPHGERFVDDVTDGVGVSALIVSPDGDIYVVGYGQAEKGGAFVLKLRAGGALEARFGRDGIVHLSRPSLVVDGAAVDRAGRLLIAGSDREDGKGGGGTSGPRSVVILRRRPNGRPDLTFSGGAPVHLSSLPARHVGAVGIQRGRRFVLLAFRGGCFRICISPTTSLVRVLGGTSSSRCRGRRATIVGTRRGERLVGTPHRDVIAALAGNDRVFGLGGSDLICGGRGGDRLIGGEGRDLLRGGAGRDRIRQ